jgi:type II secretory pathway pseudopilin PulG
MMLNSHGFTLVELLVAVIVAILIIAPLMQFMIDIIALDRIEQAKATSQQEIQLALDYIAQDLEQAVYIYNADGLYGTTITQADGSITTINGIDGLIPQIPGAGIWDNTMTPVLAFWKRYFYPSSMNVTLSSGYTITVGCLSNSSFTTYVESATIMTSCDNQDYMVYSLVVYYLANNGSSNATWNPNSQRIVRWEIHDGIRDPHGNQTRIENGQTVNYALLPDHGFYPFNLFSPGNLSVQLGNWQNLTATDPYTLGESAVVTLVDFIDPSLSSSAKLPITNCDTSINASTGLPNEEQVPNYSKVDRSFATYSFYACVNSSYNTARIFIRGNALARLQNNNNGFNSQEAAFFPTASIQVKGRGFLGLK